MVDDNSNSVPSGGTLKIRAYDDLISPSAKTVGSSLAAAVKSALRPVDGVVWTMDRAMDWVSQRLAARFEALRLGPADIASPPVQIEGPIIQALQIVGPYEDPILRNLFAGLLASTMCPGENRVRSSMIAVLRQIDPDEARLLSLVAVTGSAVLTAEMRIFWNWGSDGRDAVIQSPDAVRFHDTRDEICKILNESKPNLRQMLTNLRRLGVFTGETQHHINLGIDLPPVPPNPCPANLWEEWKTHEGRILQTGPDPTWSNPQLHSAGHIAFFRLTEWGEALVNACGASEFFDPIALAFRLPNWGQ